MSFDLPERTTPWRVLWSESESLAALQAVQDGQTRGFRVTPARTLQDAHEALDHQTFDAEVYVLRAGGGDPGHLVRLSRDLYPDPPRVRVYLVENDGVDPRLTVLSTGVDLVYRLPVSPAEVLVQVSRLMRVRSRPRPRVLVAEDDPVSRPLLVQALHDDGMDVEPLEDPQAFLQVMDAVRPHLVLLEVDLPRVGGLDLCRLVRSHPRWRAVPVVFQSVRSGVDIRMQAWRVGADDYVTKPFRPEELILRIRRQLARSWEAQVAAEEPRPLAAAAEPAGQAVRTP